MGWGHPVASPWAGTPVRGSRSCDRAQIAGGCVQEPAHRLTGPGPTLSPGRPNERRVVLPEALWRGNWDVGGRGWLPSWCWSFTFRQCLHSSPPKPTGPAGFPQWEMQPWWTVQAAAGAGGGPGAPELQRGWGCGVLGCQLCKGCFGRTVHQQSCDQLTVGAGLQGGPRWQLTAPCNTLVQHPSCAVLGKRCRWLCFRPRFYFCESASLSPRLLPTQVLTALVHLEHSLY